MPPENQTRLPYRPCVGIMMINADGLIFSGQRVDSAAPAWQMPQGGIDDGEKPRTAALRELREETGVTEDLVGFLDKTQDWLTYDLPDDLLGRIWGGKFCGQKQRWFLYRYLGRDDQINIATEHSEFEKWRWIGADEMLAAIVPFKHAVYDQVVKAFRAYLA